MCLEPRNKNSDKPYNRSRIRWKAARLNGHGLMARYVNFFYKPGGWMIAKGDKRNKRVTGFHVKLKRRGQERMFCAGVPQYLSSTVHIKVQVRGFLCSGRWSDDGSRSETWRYMRILRVFYPRNCCHAKVKLKHT